MSDAVMGYGAEARIDRAIDACDLTLDMKQNIMHFISVLETECKDPIWLQAVNLIDTRLVLLDEIFYAGYKFIQMEKPTAITYFQTRSRDGKYETIRILRSRTANSSNYAEEDYDGEPDDCIVYDLFQELETLKDKSGSPNDVYQCMRYLKSLIIRYQVFKSYRKHLSEVPRIEYEILICEGYPEAVNLIGTIKNGELCNDNR